MKNVKKVLSVMLVLVVALGMLAAEIKKILRQVPLPLIRQKRPEISTSSRQIRRLRRSNSQMIKMNS